MNDKVRIWIFEGLGAVGLVALTWTLTTSGVKNSNRTRIEAIERHLKAQPNLYDTDTRIKVLEDYKATSEPTRIKAIEELAKTNNELANINKRLDRQEKKIDYIIENL